MGTTELTPIKQESEEKEIKSPSNKGFIWGLAAKMGGKENGKEKVRKFASRLNKKAAGYERNQLSLDLLDDLNNIRASSGLVKRSTSVIHGSKISNSKRMNADVQKKHIKKYTPKEIIDDGGAYALA